MEPPVAAETTTAPTDVPAASTSAAPPAETPRPERVETAAGRGLVRPASGPPSEGAGPVEARRLLARAAGPGAAPERGPRGEGPPSESLLLGESVRLDREGDAAGALRLLDRYAETYPAGVLAAEAGRVRLGALLKSGDHRAALALVDTSSFGDAAPELLLVRAELRAEAHRCGEALPDFERALRAASDAATTERSAFGRAVCLLRTGQRDRAHEALVAYRDRFPRGRFSAEVARMLGAGAAENVP